MIDYKSGYQALDSDVYYGLQIQLVAYLDAILENGETVLKEPVLPGESCILGWTIQ